jgi:ketosteroid isomerase-like protein
VVAPWSGRLHGHGSGIEIEVSETYAVLVRDGRIARVEEYRTVEQALEAVGGPQK